MGTLQLNLLGPSQIKLSGEPLVGGLSTNKARALLFYLAVTGQCHTRHALATLLWSETSDRKARKNLRNALFDLRTELGSYLNITAQTASFNRSSSYNLDVETFVFSLKSPASQPSAAHLNEIIGLYRGEFLEGFYIRNAGAFEEWVLMQREYLQNLFLQGLDTLAGRCLEEQAYSIGLAATQRLLALEPWRETTHRQQMLFLAHIGQRQAALVQYETCRTILIEELEIPPMAETTALYEQLKSGQLPPPSPTETPCLTVRDESRPAPIHSRTLSPQPDNANRPSTQPLRPQVNWGTAPIQTPFYGRQVELNHLAHWLVSDACRLAAIFGMGGQGKTALAVQLAEALAQNRFPNGADIETGGFNRIIWRSMRNAPPFAHLLQDWLQKLTGQPLEQMPDHLDAQLALLFEQLRQQRCLLILDDFSGLLQDAGGNGQFWPGYEAYEQLLVRMTRVDHQSCLLLTSREQPREFQYLAIDSARVRSLALTGLAPEIGQEIFQAFGLVGSQEAAATLIRRYSGNPLALKLASMTIQSFFGGDMDQFVQQNTFIFAEIQKVLEEQLAPLSWLEHDILTRLALEQKPVALPTLWRDLAHTTSKREFMEALHALQQHCLLEKYVDGFAVQNLMAEYLSDGFVETICREIETEEFLGYSNYKGPTSPPTAPNLTATFLNRYELVKFQGSRYGQPSPLLQPIMAHLTAKWGQDGLEQHLHHLLTVVQTEASPPRGYAQVNLYHILKAISRIGSPEKEFYRYKESHFA